MHDPKTFSLIRKSDRVFMHFPDGKEEKPVRLVWARPISGKGQELSIMDKERKELAFLHHVDELDPESKKIAEEELGKRYFIPKIRRVILAESRMGTRYWEVETDQGPNQFIMKNPNKDIIYLTADHLILRDVIGNRYEIDSLQNLDRHSRREIDKII